MAKGPSSTRLFFFFFQFVVLCLYQPVKSSDIPQKNNFNVREKELFLSIHRTLTEYFRYKKTEFDSIDPPTTPLPSSPLTNPVTTPPINSTPGIVTVPGNNPVTNPVNPPVPVTNPVTTPSTNPPAVTGGNSQGSSWCVAKNGASQEALQSGLDYACGIGGADCTTIQQGSSCYEPATLQNHASYAFNSYYQKNPVPTSCDFEGAAAVTTTNPSTGSCVYPSSSSSFTSSPTTPISQVPVNPTSLPTAPATSSSSGSTFPGTLSPPSGFTFGNPDLTGLGSFGASPPSVSMASVVSNNVIGSLVVVASYFMFGLFYCLTGY